MQCLPFTGPRASIENIQELVLNGPYARALLGFRAVTIVVTSGQRLSPFSSEARSGKTNRPEL